MRLISKNTLKKILAVLLAICFIMPSNLYTSFAQTIDSEGINFHNSIDNPHIKEDQSKISIIHDKDYISSQDYKENEIAWKILLNSKI